MFSIKFTDGQGGDFDPKRFADEMKSKVFESANDKIRQTVEALTCPEHGRSPRYVEGELTERGSLSYACCCEKLRTEMEAVFKK